MFNSQRYKTLLLHFNPKKPCLFPPLTFPPSLNSNFCTTTSQSQSQSQSQSESFRVSYLINNIGFTPEAALKASKRLHFNTLEKPDSIFNFFRSHGFSDSNIRQMLLKEPWLLKTRPHISILPKLEFFVSKGASPSDTVSMLIANPRILQSSLEMRIIPLYELLNRFFKSEKETIDCLIRNSIAFSFKEFMVNIKLAIEYGVCDSTIALWLRTQPRVLCSPNLLELLERGKGLGFDPSTTTFGVALVAIKSVTKNKWDGKVDTFKKWGWSDGNVLQAFRRQPHVMLTSKDKINLVLSFWVNRMGWNSLALAKGPGIFAYNIQRRIIPRAAVLQFLLKNGLRKKDASLTLPFLVPEKMFLNKFVVCFKESAYLLKLYEEKMKLASTKENPGLPFTKCVPP